MIVTLNGKVYGITNHAVERYRRRSTGTSITESLGRSVLINRTQCKALVGHRIKALQTLYDPIDGVIYVVDSPSLPNRDYVVKTAIGVTK